MAIDEAGHHDLPGRVDLEGVAGSGQMLNATRRANVADLAVHNEHGSVLDQSEAPHGESAARSGRTYQRQQLPGSTNQDSFAHGFLPRAMQISREYVPINKN